MSEMHVRIMCRCTTWNVVISQLSLVEARVTHVRVNNEPSTPPEASPAHAEIYFLPPQSWSKLPRHSALHSVH